MSVTPIESLTEVFMKDIERGNYRYIESVLTDEKTYVLPISLVQMARAEAMDAGGILNPLDMLSEYPLEDTFSYLDVSLDDSVWLTRSMLQEILESDYELFYPDELRKDMVI